MCWVLHLAIHITWEMANLKTNICSRVRVICLCRKAKVNFEEIKIIPPNEHKSIHRSTPNPARDKSEVVMLVVGLDPRTGPSLSRESRNTEQVQVSRIQQAVKSKLNAATAVN